MNDTWKTLLVTVGAGVILAILIGGGTFVIDTQSRLAVIEAAVKSMDKNLERLVEREIVNRPWAN